MGDQLRDAINKGLISIEKSAMPVWIASSLLLLDGPDTDGSFWKEELWSRRN